MEYTFFHPLCLLQQNFLVCSELKYFIEVQFQTRCCLRVQSKSLFSNRTSYFCSVPCQVEPLVSGECYYLICGVVEYDTVPFTQLHYLEACSCQQLIELFTEPAISNHQQSLADDFNLHRSTSASTSVNYPLNYIANGTGDSEDSCRTPVSISHLHTGVY